MFHKDKDVNLALIRLMDSLCTWEREAGRRSLLLLIPREKDEAIVIAQDGKPILDSSVRIDPRQLLEIVLKERGE